MHAGGREGQQELGREEVVVGDDRLLQGLRTFGNFDGVDTRLRGLKRRRQNEFDRRDLSLK